MVWSQYGADILINRLKLPLTLLPMASCWVYLEARCNGRVILDSGRGRLNWYCDGASASTGAVGMGWGVIGCSQSGADMLKDRAKY